MPSPETSLPLEDAVEPNIESEDDDRGTLLLSPWPDEDTDDSLEEDFADDSLPLAFSEEELDASREEEDTYLLSEFEFGALSIRDIAA